MISRHSNSHSTFTNDSMYMPSDSKCTVPKVKCAFHPSEHITNFCTCECCLLPLCPSCVKVHTNEHINMKKINPQYEPITDLLEEIYSEVDGLLEKSDHNYKRIVEIDARVESFRNTIQQKIGSVKTNILAEVQKYFSKLEEEIEERINGMSYIQLLANYKDQTKKIIIGLKNIQKGFNPDNDKIMRIAIKYKGDRIKQELGLFQAGIDDFFKQVNNNFVTFSVREDYRQVIQSCLEGIRKIEVSDAQGLVPVPIISQKIREVYQKNSTESKRDIIKSIGNMLSHSQKKNDNDENLLAVDSYNSVSSQIPRSSLGMLRESTPNRPDNNRRSLSKGKGLSVMQVHHNCFTSNVRNWKAPKAVNISQPIEFNRTTIIRRGEAI